MSENDPQLPEALQKALKNKTAYQPPESFYTNILREVRTRPEPRSRWAWIWGPPMKLATAMGVLMISYVAIRDQIPWGAKKAAVVYDDVSSVRRAPVVAQMMDKNEGGRRDFKVVPPPANKAAALKTKVSPLSNTQAFESDAPPSETVLREVKGGRDVTGPNSAPLPWQSKLQAKEIPPMATATAFARAKEARKTEAYIDHDDDHLSAAGSSAGEMMRARQKDNELAGKMWKGTDSVVAFSRTAVISTAADWAVLWRAHSSLPVPAIDFDHAMVVGVFTGTRADLSGVAISEIETSPDGLLITYREIPQLPNQGATAGENRPYILRLIPKTTLPVHFKKIP